MGEIYQVVYQFTNDPEEHIDEYATYNKARKAYLEKVDKSAADYNYVAFQAIDIDNQEDREIIQYIGNFI